MLISDVIRYKKDILKFLDDHITVFKNKEEYNMTFNNTHRLILESFFTDHRLCIMRKNADDFSSLLKVLCLYLVTFNAGCSIGIISKDTSFLDDIYLMLRKIPIEIRPRVSTYSQYKCVFTNGSIIHSRLIPVYDNINVRAIFIGVTLHILFIDDADHIKNLQDLIVSIFPSLAAVHNALIKTQLPYGFIIASDLNNIRRSHFDKLWIDSVIGNSILKPITFRWEVFDDLCKLNEVAKRKRLIRWYMKTSNTFCYSNMFNFTNSIIFRKSYKDKIEFGYGFK